MTRSYLCCGAVVALVTLGIWPDRGHAGIVFDIDPANSLLTLSDATLSSPLTSGVFTTDITPRAGTVEDFTRTVGGTLTADPATGFLEGGSIQFLGDALLADQTKTRHGFVHDFGDVEVSGFAVDMNTTTTKTVTAGITTFNVSTGVTRVRLTTPFSLQGAKVTASDSSGTPTVTPVGGQLLLTVPVDLRFENVDVIPPGLGFTPITTSFSVRGTLQATAIPEPSSFLLLALATASAFVAIRLSRRLRNVA